MQPTILVADDDESIRLLLVTLLNEAGYRTLAAADGREAFRLAIEHLPDLALLDVMMPEMDGFATCRALKADRHTQDIPIILLTALAQTPSKVQGLDCGASDYVTKPFDAAELLARLRTILSEKNRRDALAAEALTDALTSLTNRRGLEQQLDQLLAHAQRNDETLSIAMFDADRFKSVNDNYGHETGDVVLAALAQRARESLRAQDAVGRYGGEEFLAILPGTGREAALAAAERLRAHIAATPVDTPSGPVGATVSVGVATAPQGAEPDRAALVAVADQALYAAKRAGRNRVVHADGQPTAPLTLGEPPEAARALLEALALLHAPSAEHSRAVAETCWLIGTGLRLAAPERNRIAVAGLLHDIGKLTAPAALLNAARPLGPQNAAALRCHIQQGAELLQRLPALSDVAHLVAAHQEWWDGSGYPRGLRGEQIPLGSRIVAVADAYDELQRSSADAAPALRRGAGSRFDSAVVDAALRMVH